MRVRRGSERGERVDGVLSVRGGGGCRVDGVLNAWSWDD